MSEVQPSLCPKLFEDTINLVNPPGASWSLLEPPGATLMVVESRSQMLYVARTVSLICPDLSWYNNYPSGSGCNDFTLSTYCDQWPGVCVGAQHTPPVSFSLSLSKSREEYKIICYILTGSSHTHISQLMVLKIARVSISNDVEMSPVSLYLLEGEIGALAAQWWVLLRPDCVFTEPGKLSVGIITTTNSWDGEVRCGVVWGGVVLGVSVLLSG